MLSVTERTAITGVSCTSPKARFRLMFWVVRNSLYSSCLATDSSSLRGAYEKGSNYLGKLAMFQRSHLIVGADDAASSNVRPGLANYENVPLDVIECHRTKSWGCHGIDAPRLEWCFLCCNPGVRARVVLRRWHVKAPPSESVLRTPSCGSGGALR